MAGASSLEGNAGADSFRAVLRPAVGFRAECQCPNDARLRNRCAYIVPTSTFGLILDGYGGFDWQNFYYINKNYLPGTGYEHGTVSGTNAAFNGFGSAASIIDPSGYFNFDSVDLTAAFIPGLNVTVNGYNTNVSASPIFTRTVSLSTTGPTLFNFDGLGDFSGVNKLTFTSDPNSAGPEFVMDNFTSTPTPFGTGVPEPGSLVLAAVAIGGLLIGFRRRRLRAG